MKLVWLPAAVGNRDDQLNYLAERNPDVALRMGDQIRISVHRLSEHPHSGRPGRLRGTRELVIGGTPNIIAYAITAESVIVLRLFHGAQHWPDVL